MPIIGVGTDICCLKRFIKAIRNPRIKGITQTQHQQHWIRRILSAREQTLLKEQLNSKQNETASNDSDTPTALEMFLAVRFSAKESVYKALSGRAADLQPSFYNISILKEKDWIVQLKNNNTNGRDTEHDIGHDSGNDAGINSYDKNSPSNRPIVILENLNQSIQPLAIRSKGQSVVKCHLSISHDAQKVITFCVAEEL